jgi:hypothetical protein
VTTLALETVHARIPRIQTLVTAVVRVTKHAWELKNLKLETDLAFATVSRSAVEKALVLALSTL